MIGSWVKLEDHTYNGIVVHEIKCPICKHKETYHFIPPVSCYVCGAELSIKEGEENETNLH